MNARCSRSCCAVGVWLCSGTPLSSCLTRASDVLEMPTGSGGEPDPDWSGGDAWTSGHLLSWGDWQHRTASVIILSRLNRKAQMMRCWNQHKNPTATEKWRCLLSLVTRIPLSVSVLGVGRVAAVSRGVGALILASLAPSPPWCLAHGAPYSCVPAIHTPSLSCCTHLPYLAPAGGAVDLALSQQIGLDARRASSQQTELLQRNDDQQRKKKREKKGKGQKEH